MEYKELCGKLKRDLNAHFDWLLYGQHGDLNERRGERLHATSLDARGVDLSSLSFKKAGLEKADFSNANLRCVDFRSADLTYANFTRADLYNAAFNGAYLHNALFKYNKNIVFRTVNFIDRSSSFLHALNTGSKTLFFSAVFNNMAYTFDEMVNLISKYSKPAVVQLRLDILIALDKEISDFKKKDFDEEVSKLKKSYTEKCSKADKTNNIQMLDAQLKSTLELHRKWLLSNGMSGERAVLRSLNLSGADLSSAALKDADLSLTSMAHCNLTNANLFRASLKQINLFAANLSNVDFHNAIIQDVNFGKVKSAIIRRIRERSNSDNFDLLAIKTNCGTWFVSSFYDYRALTFAEAVAFIANFEAKNFKTRLKVLTTFNDTMENLELPESTEKPSSLALMDLRATPALVKLLSQAERITRRNINYSKDVTTAEDSIELAKNIDAHNTEVIARLIKNAPSSMELFSLLYPVKDYKPKVIEIISDTLDWIFHSQLPKQKNE